MVATIEYMWLLVSKKGPQVSKVHVILCFEFVFGDNPRVEGVAKLSNNDIQFLLRNDLAAIAADHGELALVEYQPKGSFWTDVQFVSQI
jgi:hypothetical protein